MEPLHERYEIHTGRTEEIIELLKQLSSSDKRLILDWLEDEFESNDRRAHTGKSKDRFSKKHQKRKPAEYERQVWG